MLAAESFQAPGRSLELLSELGQNDARQEKLGEGQNGQIAVIKVEAFAVP